MGSSRAKSFYLTRVELAAFSWRYRDTLYFLSGTFAESVLDKHESERRFKPLRDWLDRRGVPYLGVWQRQRRRGYKEGNEGAWHYHLLLGRRVDVVAFRKFAVEHGWGPQIKALFVHDWKEVVRDMVRYFTRDGYEKQKRVRLSIRPYAARCGNVKFSWANGVANVWRAGCGFLARQARGYWAPSWNQREEILLAGCAALKLNTAQLIQLGLDRLIGWRPSLAPP